MSPAIAMSAVSAVAIQPSVASAGDGASVPRSGAAAASIMPPSTGTAAISLPMALQIRPRIGSIGSNVSSVPASVTMTIQP